jgi:hypothetical protein
VLPSNTATDVRMKLDGRTGALGSLTIDLTLSHSQDVPDMLAGEYARTDQLERKGTKDEGTAGGGDWEELRWSHMCAHILASISHAFAADFVSNCLSLS